MKRKIIIRLSAALTFFLVGIAAAHVPRIAYAAYDRVTDYFEDPVVTQVPCASHFSRNDLFTERASHPPVYATPYRRGFVPFSFGGSGVHGGYYVGQETAFLLRDGSINQRNLVSRLPIPDPVPRKRSRANRNR